MNYVFSLVSIQANMALLLEYQIDLGDIQVISVLKFLILAQC